MKIITAQQMIELEQRFLKEYSIAPIDLMENAGRGIAEWLDVFFAKEKLTKDILIICGSGNNGGDGFTAAQYLFEMGFNVQVLCLTKESDLKGPAKVNYKKIKKIRKINIYRALNKTQVEKISILFEKAPLILDCILGIGRHGEVRGFTKELIEYVNGLGKVVVSVDIPSGLDANTGSGFSIKAHTTLSMGFPKVGLFKSDAGDAAGYIYVADIGLPKDLAKDVKSNFEYISHVDFAGLVVKRQNKSHKGNFGHVLILAGSRRYSGAAVLCALGALRSGAGLVTLGVPISMRHVYQTKLNESMVLGLPETEEGTLSEEAYDSIMEFSEDVSCIALGPGISKHPGTTKLVKKIISASKKPLVIDADGINAIAEELLVLRRAKAPLILTPHPGEMARLLHTSVKSVQNDRWKITKELAEKYGITVILKGFHSVVAGEDKKIYINGSGNPGMATGGMGDVLTGVVASFLAQGFKPLDCARLAVYIHGAAGDIVAEEKGEIGILAGDVAEKIPYTLKKLYCK